MKDYWTVIYVVIQYNVQYMCTCQTYWSLTERDHETYCVRIG